MPQINNPPEALNKCIVGLTRIQSSNGLSSSDKIRLDEILTELLEIQDYVSETSNKEKRKKLVLKALKWVMRSLPFFGGGSPSGG